MKLLIDIPEHIYEHAKEESEDSRDEFEAMRAIANGSPARCKGMNEAEKERLIKKDIASIENRVRSAFNQGYEMGVKESRSENPNKWIPVESALPEVVVGEHDIRCSEDVLVYDGDDLRVGYFVRIEKLDRGYWNIYGDDCFEPIAWTQLPQPYKAESEVQE